MLTCIPNIFKHIITWLKPTNRRASPCHVTIHHQWNYPPKNILPNPSRDIHPPMDMPQKFHMTYIDHWYCCHVTVTWFQIIEHVSEENYHTIYGINTMSDRKLPYMGIFRLTSRHVTYAHIRSLPSPHKYNTNRVFIISQGNIIDIMIHHEILYKLA